MNQPASFPFTATETLLIIAAIGSALVAVITAWRTKGDVKEVKTEVGKVHELVNSRASKQDELNKELQAQISVLIATIAKKDQQEAIAHDRVIQSAAIQEGVLSERTSQARATNTAIEANVETIKEDVKAVQLDVKDVKAEVTKKE